MVSCFDSHAPQSFKIVKNECASSTRFFAKPLLNKFGLSVAPEKTQLLRFSRFHPGKRRCFTFLGFDFYWNKDRSGQARLRRRTAASKQRDGMKSMAQWIKENRHQKLSDLMRGFRQRLDAFCNYFGLAGNGASVSKYYAHALHSLFKWLNRRSQRRSCNWEKLKQMLLVYRIRQPRLKHPRNLKIDWYGERLGPVR